MSSEPAISIVHNRADHRFETRIEGALAVCDYDRRDSAVVFTHTFVPPELRGRGIAEQLVRAGLRYARDEKLKVVPACSYVGAFIQRHAEFQDLVKA
jgi:predicted GNAT family acetyltransferase